MSDLVEEGAESAAAPAQVEEEIVYGEPPQEVLPPELVGKTFKDVQMVLQAQGQELEAAKAENERLKALGDPTKVIVTGFEGLQKSLAGLGVGQQSAPQSAPVDRDTVRKRRNEAISSDPAQGVEQVVQEEVLPVLGMMANMTIEQSRRLLQVDPETKDLYKRYGEEIEREVQRVSPGERIQNAANLYQRAAEVVRGRHYGDLLDAEVQKRVAEALAGKGAGAGAPSALPGAAPAQRPFVPSAPSAAAPAAPAKKTLYYPPALKDYAQAYGIPEEVARRRYDEGLVPGMAPPARR